MRYAIFVQRMPGIGNRVRSYAIRRSRSIAAVGPATAQAAADAGLRVDYIGTKSHWRVARAGTARIASWSKVLLPRSDRGDDRLPSMLREAGAQVTEVVAYRTAAPESLDARIVDRVQRARSGRDCFRQPVGVSQSERCDGREAPGGTFVASGFCGDWANHGARFARSCGASGDRSERIFRGGAG